MNAPKKIILPKKTLKDIKALVGLYNEKKSIFKTTADTLTQAFMNDERLNKHIHSLKSRIKDSGHLEEKLIRKYKEAKIKGKKFNISGRNLFTEVTDLAGIRIIHLNTKQMDEIKPALEDLLADLKYKVIEKIAYTWDDEHRAYFKKLGFKDGSKDTLYTSIHYIVEVNRLTKARCEIQIRTLMEEVWGEVSHTINYPKETSSISCKEQLKALARVSSGGSRLVDSIFASKQEHDSRSKK